MENLLPQKVVQEAASKGLKIATAESCTGGMVSTEITSISGSSAVFEGAFITYSNNMKTSLLDVNPQTLDNYGAVSAQVAEEMAKGAREKAQVDITLSLTGVAGPTGGTNEKPVGLVYFGLSTASRTTHDTQVFTACRDGIRTQATKHGLTMILEAIQNA